MSAIPIPQDLLSADAGRPEPSTGFTATWLVYATVFASTCIVVGLIWDISWHRTVGRDTFWTYPHVLEQIAAIIAGLGSGWLVLRTTFGQRDAAAAERRATSVKIWGFSGPLGAWVCIWGAVMMVTSAPFDNWWHNAYGLDVKIISPPHMVLAAGMVAIELGALLMVLAAHNRARQGGTLGGDAFGEDMLGEGTLDGDTLDGDTLDGDTLGEDTLGAEGAGGQFAARDWKFGLIYVLAAGVIICMIATAMLERAGFANEMHGSFFYKITACLFPLLLVACARGGGGARFRWPATTAAAIYMLIGLVMMWTLQLFPATPKLAPIYNPVTHMVPPPFPYLLIVPAILIDLVLHRVGQGRDWLSAAVLGIVFVGSFLVVQWYFAEFLMSAHARNFFFAADLWDYNLRPGAWQRMYWSIDRGANGLFSQSVFLQGIVTAAIFGIISARFGLWIGNAMQRVKR